MSSLALFGICAAAVKVCVTATQKGVKWSIDGVNWLATSSQRELELLEKKLAENQKETEDEKEEEIESELYLTTVQAGQEYQQIYEKARKLAKQNPLLAKRKEAVGHFFAAKHSTLGKFVTPQEASYLDTAGFNKASADEVIHQATQRFVYTNREIIARGICEVASEAGFTKSRLNEQRDGRHYMVMSDASGKAVVAEIAVDRQGDIKTNIDLVGYSDDTCHQVMSEIVARLRDKQILLDQSERRDHFQILGEILPKLRSRKQYRKSQTTDGQKNPQRSTSKQLHKVKA